MFCVQENNVEANLKENYSEDKDPLDSTSQNSDTDEEPEAKRAKLNYSTPGLNLQVYQIPSFNIPKSLSIFPTTPTSTLPKFVNNPLNLANPLTITTNGNYNPAKRYSAPAKLNLQAPKSIMSAAAKIFDMTGGMVRFKKNGEVAKKRGPPKGYKRKPKGDSTLVNISNGVLTQAQNLIISNLLSSATNTTKTKQSNSLPTVPANLTIVPQIKVPPGVEVVELELDPADWFPEEPYKMVFSRKKNPKWKNFPYQCEHCFKGYRVLSTLLSHMSSRHGCSPRAVSVPCPCCPHVSVRRKHHTKHLETHEGRKRRIYCQYCLPISDPSEPYVKESEKYPYSQFPQYWYASEESLRLHRKRKHPYAALYNQNWYCTWGDSQPNS